MADPSRIEQFARQFHENGMKLLLEHAGNVRDLLAVAGRRVSQWVDFGRLKQVQTTFVHRDYRHVESDVVLTAPLKPPGSRSRKNLLIYILIEHQAQPDRLMPLRMADYQIQIFKYQQRQWSQTHKSFARFRLTPVLPVVFYTGTRRWKSVGTLADLMEFGDHFQRYTPRMDPLFINLPAIAPKKLESAGGFFGWVLRLVQQRESRHQEFSELLQRVVAHLETMPQKERLRWLDLLSYIEALIYHVRNPVDQPKLQRQVEASVTTDEHRREVAIMGKTAAEALMEKAGIKTLQRTLLRQLEKRFGSVPRDMIASINATEDAEQLDVWLEQFATAKSLKDISVGRLEEAATKK